VCAGFLLSATRPSHRGAIVPKIATPYKGLTIAPAPAYFGRAYFVYKDGMKIALITRRKAGKYIWEFYDRAQLSDRQPSYKTIHAALDVIDSALQEQDHAENKHRMDTDV
jgi:hypothetical protein